MVEALKRLGICDCCRMVGTSEKEPLKVSFGFIENENGLYFGQIDFDACCARCREKIYLGVQGTVWEIQHDPERGKNEQ